MEPVEGKRCNEDAHLPPTKVARTEEVPPSAKRIAIELCCGHAGLTKALWEAGFHAIGIDWAGNRHDPVVPIIQRDLSDPVDQKKVLEMIHKASYVHVGLPCGTYTEARNVPVPAWLRAQGAPQPAPLRSHLQPRGLDGLSAHNQLKVDKANAITDFIVIVIRACCQDKIPFTIENPTRSILWLVHSMKQAIATYKLAKYDLHACMFGSTRKKKTSLLTNAECFSSLQIKCDDKHSHEAWGVKWEKGGWKFATAEEAEYPAKLCKAIAAAIGGHYKEDIGLPPAILKTRTKSSQAGLTTRAQTGRQHRRFVHSQAVPERKPSETWQFKSNAPIHINP